MHLLILREAGVCTNLFSAFWHEVFCRDGSRRPDIYAQLLKHAGFQVDTTTPGELARVKLERTPPRRIRNLLAKIDQKMSAARQNPVATPVDPPNPEASQPLEASLRSTLDASWGEAPQATDPELAPPTQVLSEADTGLMPPVEPESTTDQGQTLLLESEFTPIAPEPVMTDATSKPVAIDPAQDEMKFAGITSLTCNGPYDETKGYIIWLSTSISFLCEIFFEPAGPNLPNDDCTETHTPLKKVKN
ncbi:MAG: hypothetical protein LBB26_04355, partial [Puniceicoccales bacterium]|nr:hypothetical protein [Puniceicoccales bacterium]